MAMRSGMSRTAAQGGDAPARRAPARSVSLPDASAGPRRRWVLGGLGVLLVIGSVALASAAASASSAAKQRDRRATDVAAAAAFGRLQQTLGSLRGASALSATGPVLPEAFAAYATDVLDGSLLPALAYAVVVPEANRAEFEERTGLTLRDADGTGGFAPAQARERHAVVEFVYPLIDSTRTLPGFDLASDPVRDEATRRAAETKQPVFGSLVRLQGTGRPGMLVAHAVRSASGDVVGYVSGGVGLDSINEVATKAAGANIAVTLEVDGERAFGSGRGPAASLAIGGRTITVRADDPDGIDLWLPALIVVGLAVVAGVLVASYRRDQALVAARLVQAGRHRAIADLGERLAAAATVEDVVAETLAHAGSIMDATHTSLGRRNLSDDNTTLLMAHDRALPPDLAVKHQERRLDEAMPLAECVRTGEIVVVTDRRDAVRFPDLLAAWIQVGASSIVCVPLVFQGSFVYGGLTFAFTDPLPPGSAQDEVTASATTIGQLVARALERAVLTEALSAGVHQLKAFAEALTGAASTAEVAAVVATHAPTVVGARTAVLSLRPDANATGTTSPTKPSHTHGDRALVEQGTELRVRITSSASAALTFRWTTPVPISPAAHAVAQTLAGMVGETLARADTYDQQHQLIVEFQRALLTPAPDVPGLELATRYQPAATAVGLGGDWYDVVRSRTGYTYIIVGDVSGHGAQAVALMARLKTLILELLAVDTPVQDVLDHASELLKPEVMFATATIATISPGLDTFAIVNAGHPYALWRHHDGTVTQLAAIHRPLLGMDRPTTRGWPDSVEDPFAPGDTLLLYTDGLIERRTTPLTDSIDQLALALGGIEPAATLEAAIEQLITASIGESSTADDVVVVLARRTAHSEGE